MVEKRLLKEFKFMLILTASDSGFKKNTSCKNILCFIWT
jgi:hypothetical protein